MRHVIIGLPAAVTSPPPVFKVQIESETRKTKRCRWEIPETGAVNSAGSSSCKQISSIYHLLA